VTKGEADLFSSYPSERIGSEMGTRRNRRGVEARVDERTVKNLAGCARIFKVTVEGDGVGQAMCLGAHAGGADWVAGLDGLGVTGKDVQIGTLDFRLPSEDVVFDPSDFLLGEGPGRDRAGQSGGSS